MTDPRTPGDVITRSVQRHRATVDASRALADDIAADRAKEAAAPQEPTPEGAS